MVKAEDIAAYGAAFALCAFFAILLIGMAAGLLGRVENVDIQAINEWIDIIAKILFNIVVLVCFIIATRRIYKFRKDL